MKNEGVVCVMIYNFRGTFKDSFRRRIIVVEEYLNCISENALGIRRKRIEFKHFGASVLSFFRGCIDDACCPAILQVIMTKWYIYIYCKLYEI